MRRAALLIVVLSAACSRRSQSVPDASLACTSNADCAGAWVCLAGRCADPSGAALYEHPQNAVTPDKVKQEVEQTLEREHEKTLEDRVH